MIQRLFRAFVIVVFAAVTQSGCSADGPRVFTEPPVRVVCTTTIVADVVRRVGGERVTVETLMGAGVDPHRYQPTPGDRAKLDAAHLVFFNGLHLEGKMADVFEKGRGRFRGFAVARGIPRESLRPAEPGTETEYDPHVWFDVRLWQATVGCVRAELAALDPAGADEYSRNADDYTKELAALDKEVREAVLKVPPTKRVLVTSHDAFGYFGRAYGFEVRGLQGVSTVGETGTTDRQQLAEYLGRNHIPAVFTETSVPSEGLKAVLDTCRNDWKHDVRLVGGDDALYSDALGEPGTPAGTYAGMIRHNVGVIVAGLSK